VDTIGKIRVLGEVVRMLNRLSTAPFGFTGEWRYGSIILVLAIWILRE
jgi:hypothetical protein